MMGEPLIIDAWAQPLRREAFAKMPEVARLFQQFGSAHWLNITLTPEPTVALMNSVRRVERGDAASGGVAMGDDLKATLLF